jgi:hypothetical protein
MRVTRLVHEGLGAGLYVIDPGEGTALPADHGRPGGRAVP